jgi:hypothetical protein
VNLEITPEPDDAERAAIEAALEAEEKEKEQADPPRWAKGVVPVHDGHDEPREPRSARRYCSGRVRPANIAGALRA